MASFSDPCSQGRGILLAIASLISPAAIAQLSPDKCAAGEYSGYSIRSVETHNPFDFVPFIKHRMETLRTVLPIANAATFSEDVFNQSYAKLKSAVETGS